MHEVKLPDLTDQSYITGSWLANRERFTHWIHVPRVQGRHKLLFTMSNMAPKEITNIHQLPFSSSLFLLVLTLS